MAKIFLICPVRNVTDEEKTAIAKYVANLESQGHKVYWPLRDTDQNDEIGLRICLDNLEAMKPADEVHIWWNSKSEGSVFDLGEAFALRKKLVIANPHAVKSTAYKSFTNVLLVASAAGYTKNTQG